MAERDVAATDLFARTNRGNVRPVIALLVWGTAYQLTARPLAGEAIRLIHAAGHRPSRNDEGPTVSIAVGPELRFDALT